MGTQGPRQQPACSRQLNAGGALTLTTWSSLRSTLAQESERSSNARNCGKTEGSGGPGWHRGHRQAPRKPHLLLRLLGGPRAGIPNGPVFRRGGQLLGLPERTRTGAPQVRAAWAARTADTRAPPVYSLLARDEVESLVDQGVEVFHLATRAGSEGEEGGAPRAPHTTRPGAKMPVFSPNSCPSGCQNHCSNPTATPPQHYRTPRAPPPAPSLHTAAAAATPTLQPGPTATSDFTELTNQPHLRERRESLPAHHSAAIACGAPLLGVSVGIFQILASKHPPAGCRHALPKPFPVGDSAQQDSVPPRARIPLPRNNTQELP